MAKRDDIVKRAKELRSDIKCYDSLESRITKLKLNDITIMLLRKENDGFWNTLLERKFGDYDVSSSYIYSYFPFYKYENIVGMKDAIKEEIQKYGLGLDGNEIEIRVPGIYHAEEFAEEIVKKAESIECIFKRAEAFKKRKMDQTAAEFQLFY